MWLRPHETLTVNLAECEFVKATHKVVLLFDAKVSVSTSKKKLMRFFGGVGRLLLPFLQEFLWLLL